MSLCLPSTSAPGGNLASRNARAPTEVCSSRSPCVVHRGDGVTVRGLYGRASRKTAWIEYDRSSHPFREDLIGGAIRMVNGKVAVPQTPGIGVEVDREILDPDTVAGLTKLLSQAVLFSTAKLRPREPSPRTARTQALRSRGSRQSHNRRRREQPLQDRAAPRAGRVQHVRDGGSAAGRELRGGLRRRCPSDRQPAGQGGESGTGVHRPGAHGNGADRGRRANRG